MDKVGNIGTWSNTDTVYIDTDTPPAPAYVVPTHPNQNQWYQNDSIGVILTRPADISGIEGYHWVLTQDSIYTIAPTNYWLTSDTLIINVLPSMDTIPHRIPDGIWYLHIAAKDGVGHLSQTQTYRIKIDKTAPETRYIVLHSSPIDTIKSCTHSFNLVVEDYPMYTTYATYHSVNGNNLANSASVSLTNYRLNKIYFYSQDDAGNQEAMDSVMVYLAGTDSLNMANPALSCTPLGIILYDFSAISKTNHIQLEWVSSQEINAAIYELEKSLDAKHFEFLNAQIAQNKPSFYDYVDKEVLV